MGDTFQVKVQDLKLNSNIKVMVTCDRCGETYSTTYQYYNKSSTKGDYCFSCSRKVSHETLVNRNLSKWFDELKQTVESNGYELVSTVEDYQGTYTKLKYICPKHGEQYSSPNNLKTGHGCKQCGIEKTSLKTKNEIKDIKKYIESVNDNEWLNPIDYKNAHCKNLEIRCGICHERTFTVSYVNYKNGTQTCLFCSRSMSKGERRIYDFLKSININFIKEAAFDGCIMPNGKRTLSYDFYLCDYNLVIEYDSEIHYDPHFYYTKFKDEEKGLTEFENAQERDAFKTQFCIDNGIHLLRIPYWELDCAEELILDNIYEIELDKRYSLVS